MIDPFCRRPGEIEPVDVQALQPNAVAQLHGHQRISSISVPLPMAAQRRKERPLIQTDANREKTRRGRG